MAARPPAPPPDRASATPVFKDGLGARVRVTDAGGDVVEQLQLTSDIAAQESAIRDRVGRLVNFRHARYVRLRGVDRAKTGTKPLVVAYDALDGHRLSSVLETLPKLSLNVEVDIALQIIRDLLPAIGILHDSRKVTHGAIALERLVYTSQQRLVIVDHGLGAALARMNLPRKKLWDQYRIASPATTRALFDEKMDVVQIGLVALSLLLGRPLTEDDYPAQVKRLIFSVKEVSSRIGSRPIGPELRRWLERATGIDEAQTFNAIKEAQDAFETVVAVDRYAPSAAAVKAFFVRYEELIARLPVSAPAAVDAPEKEKKVPGAAIDVDSALSQLAVTIAPRRRTPAPGAEAGAELAPPAAAQAVELKPPAKGRPARAAAEAEAAADAVAEQKGEAPSAGTKFGRRKADTLDALQALQEMALSGDISALEQTANAVYEDAAAKVAPRSAPVDDSERVAREAAERARQEAEAREQAEREGRALAEQVARTAAEQVAREAAERAEAERQARAASEREAMERGARQEAERQAHEASLRATREASDREAAERAAREAGERADRATREAEARADRAEREAGERVVRVEREAAERAERVARETAEQAAAERAAREQEVREQVRQELAEREATERQARELAEREARAAAELAAKEAADRAAAERAAQEAAARAEREAAERSAAEKAAREAADRAEREAAERAAAQEAAREARERAEREATERAAAERALREAAERAERAEREAVERAARAEREATERAERAQREAIAREAAERQAREHAEREARANAERAAKEAAERAAAERAAREAAERAERAERQSAERADRVAREAAERAAQAAREAAEREAAHVAAREAAEQAVLEAAEREAAHRVALEAAERAVREAAERADVERAARQVAEQAAREAAERALADLASQHAGTRTEMEAASRMSAERAARDAAEAAEAARVAREQAERHAEERAAAQQAAREAAERAEREATERAAAERSAREHAARAETEREARAAAELEARRAAERADRHAAERHAAERAAREAAALMEAEREARAAAEARAREVAEQAAAERAAREAAVEGDGRRRRRKKRAGLRTADEFSAVEPQPSFDDTALATATTFAAPMPGPSSMPPPPPSDQPLAGVVAWQPGQSLEAMPAWARGAASEATPPSEPSPEAEVVSYTPPPSGAAPSVDAPLSIGPVSGGPVSGSPVSIGPASGGPSILPFPAKADTWMHRAPQVDASVAAVAAAAAEEGEERQAPILAAPRRRFSVNWARTLAASLLVALLEGVAFATAWWYVTPEQEGWLIVHTKPAGIQVSVDGMVLGQTPFAKPLAPGRHTIELRYGTGTRVVPVEISAGVQTEQRLTWGNGFTTGQASITSTPKGSQVSIDGRVLGKTPLMVSDLLPGKHEVAIESDSGSVTQMLMIEAGQTTELDVPVYAGWVSVLSPVQLQITLGGRLIGTTEIEKLLLKPGHHTLGLTNESLGYKGTVEVRVRPGATSSVSVVPKTSVTVEAPEGTELSVNGESMGTLPNTKLEVPLGTAEFVMRYKDEERRVVMPVTMLSPVVVRYDGASTVEPESR
jgi:hypothetical protein